MKNVKIKDFRQGKTLYYVMAFPLRERMGGHATVQVYNIESIAYKKPGRCSFYKTSLWFDTIEWSNNYFTKVPELRKSYQSITDCGVGVGKTNYNFHRVFNTRKQAQRYADRMNSGCLTHEERKHAECMNERDERWAEVDRLYDYESGWDD